MKIQVLVHDPLTRFLAQLVAVVVISRLLGLVTRRLGQPMVIAEITAGIVLGPSLVGWVFPEFSAAVFPSSSGVLQLVSQLGLILFMFLIGLELDPKHLKNRGHASIVISHVSIIVPFALGALLARHLHATYAPAGVELLPFALFMGTAMSITAFPVLARILSERRLLHTRVGAVTIACAAVDDITAWCLLAFVVATARATGLEAAVVTTALALAYIGFMFVAVRPLMRRLGQRISTEDGLTQSVVAVLLVLLFLSSWATELIGIHALFGAFMFGAILPKDGGLARALADKLEDLVLVVLLPLFFAYSGLRTQIGLLDTAAAWWTCGVIILVASLGKFGASTLAARFTGLEWREAGALGVLMNTRGLMELIVLNIGLDLGVLTPSLFAMMVVMALVTTFATSPILKLFYSPERVTRDLVAAPAHPIVLPTPAPSILTCVAYGGSGPGLIALASALRRVDAKEPVHALHLLQPSDRASFHMEGSPEELSASALEPLLERAKELGVDVRPLSFVSTEPAVDICDMAEGKTAEMILLGWHKPLLSQGMLGGTVHAVMKRASVDVGIFVDRGLTAPQRILVPFLGSSHDHAALMWAHRLLRSCNAEVTILHVKPEGTLPQPLSGRDLAAQVFREPEGQRVVLKVQQHISPVTAALEECRAGYDLVIVGAGPEWGLTDRRFAVQPEKLLDEAPTSLLVVRRGSSANAQPLSETAALEAKAAGR